ncbi:GntR family transcriptional regulator [Nocardioides terrisoli]|uniref:GntR family transcriptional regulator n=1 Tax=Nocardioides terrisoli TaxID=3388267 RepID=UPI00287B7C12|nr:GntR family transcriptional regulator [Nocardioides marmorisolisilvae]
MTPRSRGPATGPELPDDTAGRMRMRRGHKHVVVRDYVRSFAEGSEPGTPAPSERDLARQFGVARMTVRHAIDGLVAQGLLERVAGRGTFVARPQVDLQMRLSSYTEEMHRRGKQPEARTVMARRESAGPGVARALEVDEGAPVVHWERLRLADGEPMAVQHAYLPLEPFAALLDGELPKSLYAWLKERDLMPTWGEDAVHAGVASEETAAQLGLEPGAAVLHVARRAFCREIAVEVTRSVYRADRYTLWVPVLRPPHES